MNRWVHISQVPEGVKVTMQGEFIQFEKQDLGIETVIDGMFQTKNVTQSVCDTLRSATNSIRVPILCRAVYAAHGAKDAKNPVNGELSWRDTFHAVGLFCGLNKRHIARLYYRSSK